MDTNSKREHQCALIQRMISHGDVTSVLRRLQTASSLRFISAMVLGAVKT